MAYRGDDFEFPRAYNRDAISEAHVDGDEGREKNDGRNSCVDIGSMEVAGGMSRRFFPIRAIASANVIKFSPSCALDRDGSSLPPPLANCHHVLITIPSTYERIHE